MGWTATVCPGQDSSTSVTPAEGQQLTGVNLTLTPVSELTQCLQPALPIADYATVTSVMPLTMGAGVTVTSVEVFVDITHTYQGDLTVDLRSPAGTTVARKKPSSVFENQPMSHSCRWLIIMPALACPARSASPDTPCGHRCRRYSLSLPHRRDPP